ncbi:MAG: oxidative damage protection protein [Thermoanaerobaculia bacterium]|nr:MAG: oxidative damage protection protein [Thermoanaerobaculia bacterium]
MNGATVACARCGRSGAPALAKAPVPGPLGVEIRARVCSECWAEWRSVEVMAINELRLNFMDPSAQDILAAEMRRFLGLDGAPGTEPEKNPDPR